MAMYIFNHLGTVRLYGFVAGDTCEHNIHVRVVCVGVCVRVCVRA